MYARARFMILTVLGDFYPNTSIKLNPRSSRFHHFKKLKVTKNLVFFFYPNIKNTLSEKTSSIPDTAVDNIASLAKKKIEFNAK